MRDGHEAVARELSRAALMGARGNSGVIFSQIVRGFADVLGEREPIDERDARAGVPLRERRRLPRGAAARRGHDAHGDPRDGRGGRVARGAGSRPRRAARRIVARGEESLARTPELLAVLKRGGCRRRRWGRARRDHPRVRAAVAGEACRRRPPRRAGLGRGDPPGTSRFRYCTVFVVEGTGSMPTRWSASSSSSATRFSSSATRRR